jgi:hypothetical protein
VPQLVASSPVQTPAWQRSVKVQLLESLHTVPSAEAVTTHEPERGSHVTVRSHASAFAARQVTELPGEQCPARQVSVRVQALPSLHGAPLLAGVMSHAPVTGLQLRLASHPAASAARHTTGLPAAHSPPWQVS